MPIIVVVLGPPIVPIDEIQMMPCLTGGAMSHDGSFDRFVSSHSKIDENRCTSRERFEKFVLSQVARFRTASNCVGYIQPRTESKSRDAELSNIEDYGKTTH